MAKINIERAQRLIQKMKEYVEDDSKNPYMRIGFVEGAIDELQKIIGKPAGTVYPATHMRKPDELKRFDEDEDVQAEKSDNEGPTAPPAEVAQAQASE